MIKQSIHRFVEPHKEVQSDPEHYFQKRKKLKLKNTPTKGYPNIMLY